MKLSVVIVNHNTRHLLRDCLLSMEFERRADMEVVLVDNASTDGSPEMVEAEFPHVYLIRLAENVGFARANNIAFPHCQGEYILLLNSDTRLRPGALNALVGFGDRYPEAGAWGPRLLNADETLQRSCFRYPTPARAWLENLWISRLLPPHHPLGDWRCWAHDEVCEVDSVVGAALVVRRSVIERVGGLDERFFIYSEETDWCWRIRRAGWRVMFTPEAEIIHLGGGSAGGVFNRERQRRFFDSLDQYARKHHGLMGLILLRAAMVIGSSLRLPLWAIACLLRPARRAEATEKLRLHAWLIARQALVWPRRRMQP